MHTGHRDCRLCNHAFLDYPAVRVLCFDDRQYPSGHDFHRHQRPDQLSYQAGFTYSIIIKSDTVLQQVIDDLGLSLSYSDLKGRVTVSAVDDTQVMKITVRSNNPEWARQVCDDITAVSPDVILEAVEAGSVKVISQASYSDVPVSPNIKKNTILGAMVGLVLCLGAILLQVILDNKINTEEDVAKYLDMTVVGVIPVYEGGKNK